MFPLCFGRQLGTWYPGEIATIANGRRNGWEIPLHWYPSDCHHSSKRPNQTLSAVQLGPIQSQHWAWQIVPGSGWMINVPEFFSDPSVLVVQCKKHVELFSDRRIYEMSCHGPILISSQSLRKREVKLDAWISSFDVSFMKKLRSYFVNRMWSPM